MNGRGQRAHGEQGQATVSQADPNPKEVEMPKKIRRPQHDPMRRLVQGILTLVLSTLAGWLAAKLTDLILRPEEKREGEAAE